MKLMGSSVFILFYFFLCVDLFIFKSSLETGQKLFNVLYKDIVVL